MAALEANPSNSRKGTKRNRGASGLPGAYGTEKNLLYRIYLSDPATMFDDGFRKHLVRLVLATCSQVDGAVLYLINQSI